jgi:hypothetical protein
MRRGSLLLQSNLPATANRTSSFHNFSSKCSCKLRGSPRTQMAGSTLFFRSSCCARVTKWENRIWVSLTTSSVSRFNMHQKVCYTCLGMCQSNAIQTSWNKQVFHGRYAIRCICRTSAEQSLHPRKSSTQLQELQRFETLPGTLTYNLLPQMYQPRPFLAYAILSYHKDPTRICHLHLTSRMHRLAQEAGSAPTYGKILFDYIVVHMTMSAKAHGPLSEAHPTPTH